MQFDWYLKNRDETKPLQQFWCFLFPFALVACGSTCVVMGQRAAPKCPFLHFPRLDPGKEGETQSWSTKTGLYGRNFSEAHCHRSWLLRIPGVVVCSLLHGLHLEICNFGWLKTEDSRSSWRRACQLFKQPGWWWGGLGKFSFLWDSWWFCCLPDTIADAKGGDFVWVLFVSRHVASVGALLSLECRMKGILTRGSALNTKSIFIINQPLTDGKRWPISKQRLLQSAVSKSGCLKVHGVTILWTIDLFCFHPVNHNRRVVLTCREAGAKPLGFIIRMFPLGLVSV